jgi:hypothetical protein
MAEVKNAFIKSKMNKDLDARLIPQGEYRDAVNIQVSKSEGDDVGALENVLGNHSVADFENDSGVTGLSCIGYFVDEFNNIIYLFFTDYTDSYFTSTPTYFPNANNFIYSYNIRTNVITKLVEGAFLNFSTNRPIIGVNLLEDFLFFTDNRNQPRKINVSKANEVAENIITNGGGAATVDVTTTGTNYVNGIYTTTATSGSGSGLVVRVFAFGGGPGFITGVEIIDSGSGYQEGDTVGVDGGSAVLTITSIEGYYTNEDNISVAKYYPYEAINVFKTSGYNTNTSGAQVATADVDGSIVNSKVIEVDNVSGTIADGLGVLATTTQEQIFAYVVDVTGTTITLNREVTLSDNTSLEFNRLETSMYDVTSVNLPNSGPNNPYYDQDFPGDPQFLEDKFVRFSYRFKFDDGEYSLIAPFTQPCFIPKQDGYFLQGDERLTFTSTVVEFMENKVNKIDLQIPLPCTLNDLKKKFHIEEVDIIYKESDGLALQVVETLPIDDIRIRNATQGITSDYSFFEYSYLSQKPYKTLPDNEITRVYDKVPVKALGQEIISNRVVYSNFQTKHTPPSFLKYQVAVTDKYSTTDISSEIFSAFSTVEYPNHSVKQNRNYQIGIVLSDRYGRQSTVILSNDQSPQTGDDFGADTVYLPYRPTNDSLDFIGDSLKVLFNEVISSDKNETNLTPGLYDSDASSSQYKPLGWYSYKIVVKQLEQEYYNVYTNGAIKGLPDWSGSNSQQNTSFVTLLNDNINKVPRDLSEVGPQDKTFRSSVRLFGRVENTNRSFSNIGNEQYISTDVRLSFTTNNIEDLFDLFDVAEAVKNTPITDDANPYYAFFKSESNPFIAEFVTTQNNAADQFGLLNVENQGTPTYKKYENLAVLETAPTVSRLDLFYESSTAGLINDLNTAVASSTGEAYLIENFTYNHTEANNPGDDITTDFKFQDILGQDLTTATATMTVQDDLGFNRTSNFTLVNLGGGQFKIQTNSYFYYGSNAGQAEAYTFTFTVDVSGSISTLTQRGALTNVPPTNTSTPVGGAVINATVGQTVIITQLSGVNGSSINNPNTNTYTQGLTYSIPTQDFAGQFVIVGNTVENTNPNVSGLIDFTLRICDAGSPDQLCTDIPYTVNFGSTSNFPSDFITSGTIVDGEGTAIWFVDPSMSLSTAFADLPNYLGGQSLNNLNGISFPSAPGSANDLDIDICGSFPNPTYTGQFYNKRRTEFSRTLFQGGNVFYLIVRGINTNASQGTYPTELNVRWNFRYRSESGGPWTDAQDINGNAIGQGLYPGITGTWNYDSTIPSNGLDSFGNTAYGITGILVRDVTPGSQVEGAQVFAFRQGGEYRFLIGNLESRFDNGTSAGLVWGAYHGNTFSTSTAGSIDCTKTMSLDIQAEYEFGNFNSPSSSWAGDGTGVYEYQVADNNVCSGFFIPTSTRYYAAEPFAKYVTNLYTDQALANKATSFQGGRYRRVETIGSSAASNPEFTKDGAYTATFVNGTRTSTAIACTF